MMVSIFHCGAARDALTNNVYMCARLGGKHTGQSGTAGKSMGGRRVFASSSSFVQETSFTFALWCLEKVWVFILLKNTKTEINTQSINKYAIEL